MSEGRSSPAVWSVPEAPPAPSADRLDVWRIDLAEVDPARSLSLLDPEERARADRLRSAAARRRFALSHAALRRILGAYMDAEPETLGFAYTPAGKPRLARPGEIAFNLSHSGDLALCAVSGSGDVGVDVERIRPLRDVERLVRRNFSEAERGAWSALEPGERLHGFYRVWTRKEAMLKAAGVGLARPLERVDTRTGTLDERVWWVSGIEPGEGFAAAVARPSEPAGIALWRWAGV